MKAWYFSDETRKLRHGDGREIKLGITHEVEGKPETCARGLHGSKNILDAARYAPGNIVWYVELDGEMDIGGDKIAAQKRTYLAGGIDITDILRQFARKQALSVAHLWDMPQIVREYLETGDESKRSAAYAAADADAYAAYAYSYAAANAAYAAAYAAATADAYAADAYAYAATAATAAAYAAARKNAQRKANTMLSRMVKKAIGI